MKSALLASCAGLALAGVVGFGSGLAWGGAAKAERAAAAAIVPVAAIAGEDAAVPAPEPWRVCVQAFSKDLCDSFIERGELIEGACDEFGCRTAYVRGAPLFLNMLHNPQSCFEDGRCDEVEHKDGRLESSVTYTLRLQDPCKLRGYLEGRWQHYANDGTVYQGTVTGTMGVGTHRAFQCQTHTERQCERCLDVEFLPEQGQWRIGVEASFVGTRVSPGFTREDLRFTLSGDFFADGDENGPYELAGGWRFEGTADGAHVYFCQ